MIPGGLVTNLDPAKVPSHKSQVTLECLENRELITLLLGTGGQQRGTERVNPHGATIPPAWLRAPKGAGTPGQPCMSQTVGWVQEAHGREEPRSHPSPPRKNRTEKTQVCAGESSPPSHWSPADCGLLEGDPGRPA